MASGSGRALALKALRRLDGMAQGEGPCVGLGLALLELGRVDSRPCLFLAQGAAGGRGLEFEGAALLAAEQGAAERARIPSFPGWNMVALRESCLDFAGNPWDRLRIHCRNSERVAPGKKALWGAFCALSRQWDATRDGQDGPGSRMVPELLAQWCPKEPWEGRGQAAAAIRAALEIEELSLIVPALKKNERQAGRL